jgi:hypothetical protein
MDIYGCMDWWEQYDCILPLIPPEMIDDEENILERTIMHIRTNNVWPAEPKKATRH